MNLITQIPPCQWKQIRRVYRRQKTFIVTFEIGRGTVF
jgi:hypothetical protein